MRALLVLLILSLSGLAVAAESTNLKQARRSINKMDYSQAIIDISEHLKKHPKDTKALELLAKTYAWDNQYVLASEVYDKLLKADSNNAEYQFGKANALIWLQQNKQAVQYLEKAWALQPQNANYLHILILTLKQTYDKADLKRADELNAIAKKRFPRQVWD